MRIIQEVLTLSTHTGCKRDAHFITRQLHYKGVFFPSVLPAHNSSDICLSIPVTASALGALCQLHCIHHPSITDKLVWTSSVGAMVWGLLCSTLDKTEESSPESFLLQQPGHFPMPRAAGRCNAKQKGCGLGGRASAWLYI